MDLSRLYTLRTEIIRRIAECDDVNLLLSFYEKITGEPYPEDDKEALLEEAEAEYEIESIPFERIPGLPYTYEERMEALREAENEIKQGLGIPHDEVMKEIDSWISNGRPKHTGN